MAFHSYQFVLVFLPACYVAFLLAHRIGGWPMAFKLLAAASFVYYAQFGLKPVAILLASVAINYLLGRAIMAAADNRSRAGTLLVAGILGNVAALGYFKYTNFLLDIASQISGHGFSHLNLLLPIGISFFTFIQIGYLIEAYNGQVERQPFSRYALFATFFPCIAAGPLVLQKEMFGQMRDREDSAFEPERLATGLTLFAMGLFKKCFLADSIAPYANTVFDGVSSGLDITQAAAWAGALCYSLQLYFDFSGYSDMAIGLGVIFALKLPLNFNSPFKATNISEFWRRWHMTMTRFFTTFIYTPMAINGMRSSLTGGAGPVTRFVRTAAAPAIVTFLVAGIWHGDGYTFVIYGLIHGFAIAAYLAWREMEMPKLPKPLAWGLTMSVVVTGLVVFRADTVATATTILGNMWMPSLMPPFNPADAVQVNLREAFSYVVLLGAVVLLFPNTQQILHRNWVSIDTKPADAEKEAGLVSWRPTPMGSFATAVLFCVALSSIGASSTFLYYQF